MNPLVTAVILASILQVRPPDGKDSVARALADETEANRLALGSCFFEFEVIGGACASIEDARSGSMKVLYRAKGTYQFDGRWFRFERLVDPLGAEGVKSNDSDILVFGPSVRLLSNTEATLFDYTFQDNNKADDHTQLKLLAGDKMDANGFDFPLSMGRPEPGPRDLASDLRQSLVAGSGVVIENLDPSAVLDGMPVVHVRFAMKRGWHDYWVDVSRGAIPLRFEGTRLDGTASFLVRNDGLEKFGAAWVPRVRTTLTTSAKRAKITKIVAADPGNVAHPLDKRLSFAGVATLFDMIHGAYYPRGKSFGLDNLPTPASPNYRPLEPRQNPPALPVERPQTFPWWLVFLGALAVSAVALFAWRRRG